MDLHKRLRLAGKGLLGILDPDKGLMPTGGYEVAHDLGRWWDAALRLEEAIGFVIPAELEAASLGNLQRLTDNPDRLLMNRPDVPWLDGKVRLNPHNFRETLLAFGGLVRRRQNLWAREAALTLTASMARALQANGRLDFAQLGSWGSVPFTQDPSHTEGGDGTWFDGTATSGRAIEALVWLYEATGEPAVLDLARRIAEHHLANTINPDGSPREELFSPDNVGHDHSYQGTLRGLLLFGLLTNKPEFVDAVEATYRNTVRIRVVRESGWAPHCLGKVRFANEHGDPVADPASAGDSAQLALWLALHAGCGDLLDDVERLVRARLVPAQLTDRDMRCHSDRAFAPREVGAWCIHGPPHAGKGCTPDVHAAVIHTLCDIQRHVITRSQASTRINLHFDAETDQVKVVSTRDGNARLTVTVKQPEEVLVRIPGWAPERLVRITVDGRALPLVRSGVFARIPGDALAPGSQIVVTCELPERRTQEDMPSGRRYSFAWRGDEITGISPQDEPLPFYQALAEG